MTNFSSDTRGGDGPVKMQLPFTLPRPLGQPPWGALQDGKSPYLPLQTLSETLRTAAQTNANSLVLYAKDNPSLQHLVSRYETWESNLRNEATRRLGGFQPPTMLTSSSNSNSAAAQLIHHSHHYHGGSQWQSPNAVSSSVGPSGSGLGADDWSLLNRVKGKGPRLVMGSSFKRSASENNLQDAALTERRASGFSASSSQSPTAGGVSNGGAGGAAGQQGFYTSSFHPYSSSAGGGGTHHHHSSACPSLDGSQRLHHERGTGSDENANGDGAMAAAVRPLLPRVPTAPTLQELTQQANKMLANTEAAKNLEAVAATIINTSRLAIQSAQQSIQQTATNCQQNLQTLSSLLQQNMASSSFQSTLNGSRAMVQWGLANSGDPLSGALVPWSVMPGYMRARELEASSDGFSLGAGSETASGEGQGHSNGSGWYAPFRDYLDELEGNGGQGAARRRKRSLKDPGRQVAIVTTASLPWMTGTSVNPLLRAAYLSTDSSRKVTLVLPWLSKTDQQRVFPNNLTFETPEEQEAFVREWATQRTGLDCKFKVLFYPGRYAAEKGSILPVGDITSVIPDHEADVAVLEEPEHLSWYHHGRRWTDKFNHVVGVMHTNYLDYARREEGGAVKEMLLKHINAWVCRVHCHKVIKLSDAVQPLPREATMFVHGVSPTFLKVGESKAQLAEEGRPVWGYGHDSGIYFLGKVLWAKGYTELLDRLKEHSDRTGEKVHVDVYGGGPDLKAVEEEAGRRRLDLAFKGPKDHADRSLQDYKVFINPSLSDVVATTTAEALAMGKFVVCAEHPSNKFFETFPNCLVYKDDEGFTRCLHHALTHEPKPLSPSELHALTWEAATERFLDVAELTADPNPLEMVMDKVLAAAHNLMTGVEPLRIAAGAGANTRDMPARLTDYQPSDSDVGGLFDNHHRARTIYKETSGKDQKQRPKVDLMAAHAQAQAAAAAAATAVAAAVTAAASAAAATAGAVAPASAPAPSAVAAEPAAAAQDVPVADAGSSRGNNRRRRNGRSSSSSSGASGKGK